MKALVVTKTSAPETADVNRLAHVFASLDSMGITWGRALVEVLPSDEAINSYDFIVFPQLITGFESLINNAAITIPMFGLYSSSGTVGFGSTPGVSGSRTGLGDYFVDVPYTNEAFVVGYCGGYTALVTPGKALATISATIPNVNAVFDGTAQANPGKIVAWRTDVAGTNSLTSGTNRLYVSAFDTNNVVYLHQLMVEAINDGVMDKPPRRSPVSVDLDHINGQYAHAEPAVLDKIASYIPAGGMMWCGIFNANVLYFSSSMDAEVVTRLKKYSGNKFKYCWHDHVDLITSGSYPNITELVNKVDQETIYIADEQTWNANGLEFHQPGYYNSGSNAWSESSMELFTGDTSQTADGADAVTQQGYGFRAFRCTRSSERVQPIKTSTHQNQHAYKHTAHGIQIFGTWDMCFGSDSQIQDMPYNSIVDWRRNFQYLNNCLSFGTTIYFHDEDFVAADQDPGIDQHGWVQAQILYDMSIYMKDVIHGFADPVDYIPDMSMSLA